MAKDINRHFSKQDAGVANRYRRQKSSLSLIVEKKQIKIRRKCHLIPVRMAATKEAKDNMYGQGHERDNYTWSVRM